MRERLAESSLAEALAGLDGWSVVNAKLHREFRFGGFDQAIAFMTMAALAIGKMDHHPEWCNVYNRVSVDLTTHDAGGITSRDVELARVLDATAKKLR